ncbi:DUF2165 domain-containing protein [Actinosynnema sp. NPDC020468]|uniref:DUF2165 domain-containing protein n=1 Tax=Actinosynnema sp. NPDC020468 TaxID=3154488 RepID=UPI0033D15546
MRFLGRAGSPQVATAVLTAVSAAYMTLVAFGNITDYGTNRAFVEHVFAMDTTFRSPDLMWRAITSQSLVTAAYVLIIAWESLTAVILLAAVVSWLRGHPTARPLSSTGWVLQAVLFGLGFLAIGGEWFAMWQSKTWNGLTPAFQNTTLATLGLILLHASKPSPQLAP